MSHVYSILGYSKDTKSFVDFLEQVASANTTEENRIQYAKRLFIQKVKPGILEVEDLVESGSSSISHILNSSKKEEA